MNAESSHVVPAPEVEGSVNLNAEPAGDADSRVNGLSGSRPHEPQWPRVTRRTAEQLFFLRRLRRLTALNRYCTGELPSNDPEMRLLRQAIYSTYRDCIVLDMADEAQDILAELRGGAPPAPEASRT